MRRLVLAGLVAALVLAATLACSDPVPVSETATPTATVGAAPTPTSSPRPGEALLRELLDGVEIRALTPREPAAGSQDLPPIVETGCTQCGAPTTGFVRVYRDPSGGVRVDPLLDPLDPNLGLPPSGP